MDTPHLHVLPRRVCFFSLGSSMFGPSFSTLSGSSSVSSRDVASCLTARSLISFAASCLAVTSCFAASSFPAHRIWENGHVYDMLSCVLLHKCFLKDDLRDFDTVLRRERRWVAPQCVQKYSLAEYAGSLQRVSPVRFQLTSSVIDSCPSIFAHPAESPLTPPCLQLDLSLCFSSVRVFNTETQ